MILLCPHCGVNVEFKEEGHLLCWNCEELLLAAFVNGKWKLFGRTIEQDKDKIWIRNSTC